MPLNEPEIIEAEIVENNSEQGPLPRADISVPAWHTPGDHARPQGDHGGMLGGFLVLALGFVVTILVLLISIFIIIPFTLLMRLLGMHKRN